MPHRTRGSGREWSRRFRRLARLAWPVMLIAAAGCQSYHWRTDYFQAEQDARDQKRPLFIFYKWWLDEDSNRMLSREVLSAPDVVAQFQDTINVLVERGGGAGCAQYMSKYGVNSFPASVVVAPDGRFEVISGFLPKDQFLDFVRRAKATGGRQASPAGKTTSGAQVPGPASGEPG